MEAKLREIPATAIDVVPADLTDQSSPDNTPEWDSFAHLNTVAAMEKAFGVGFTLEEIIETQSLPRIKAVVSRKL